MRSINFKSVFIAMIALVWASIGQAQYDDLYYNPDEDNTYNYSNSSNSYDDYKYDDDDYDYDNYSYDDNSYEYNDYDYQYSSRIRRFHRPYYGFNYFDPCYVDLAYYDPFFSPVGTTVLIYDDLYSFNSYRRLRRWNRWNAWGGGFNSWGISVGWGNPWFNNGWGSGWNRWNNWGPGWNRWNRWNDPWFNSGFSNFYCPPSWGNNFNYNTVVNVNNPNDRYYGPRRSGSTKAPRSGVIRTQSPKDVTNTRNINSGNDFGKQRARTIDPELNRNGTRYSDSNRRRSEARTSNSSERTRTRTETRSRKRSETRQKEARSRTSRSYDNNSSNKRGSSTRSRSNSNSSRSRGYNNNSSRSRSNTKSYNRSNSRSRSNSSSTRSRSSSSSRSKSSSRSSSRRGRGE